MDTIVRIEEQNKGLTIHYRPHPDLFELRGRDAEVYIASYEPEENRALKLRLEFRWKVLNKKKPIPRYLRLHEEPTLTKKWSDRLRNHPFFAAVILGAGAITTFAAALQAVLFILSLLRTYVAK